MLFVVMHCIVIVDALKACSRPLMSFLFEKQMSVFMLEQYREKIRTELDNVVNFWMTYSHDTEYG